jgi:hypothetical protein
MIFRSLSPVRNPIKWAPAALLICTAAIYAQTAGPVNLTLQNGNEADNCPTSLTASMRTGRGVLSSADKRKGSNGSERLSQHIRINLAPSMSEESVDSDGTGSKSSRPLRARITVRGTNGSSRVEAASATASDPSLPSPWIEKVLDIKLLPVAPSDGETGVYADIELPGFTSVRSIRLDTLTYTNGGSWTPVSGQVCRVTPDPLMLVGTR